MKKLSTILIIGSFLSLGIIANAQEVNVTNAVPPMPAFPTNAPSATINQLVGNGGWGHAAKDVISYIEGTTNSGLVQIEAGALIGQSSHKVGGFINTFLPLGGTNSIFGAGFGLAYFDHNFYDATINARVGDKFNLPFIRIPVYAYLESGGGWNISENRAMAQAFSGFTLPIPITQNSTVTVGFAYGTISDLGETIMGIGGSYTWKF